DAEADDAGVELVQPLRVTAGDDDRDPGEEVGEEEEDPPEQGDDDPRDRQQRPEKGGPSVRSRVEIGFVVDWIHRAPLVVDGDQTALPSLTPAPAAAAGRGQ